MFKDQYIENAKKIYAVRAANLIGKHFDEDYFEFAHKLFETSEIEMINKLIVKKMYQLDLQDEPKKITKTIKNNYRSGRPTLNKSKNTDEEFGIVWVTDKAKELDNSKNDSSDWAKEPENFKIYVA